MRHTLIFMVTLGLLSSSSVAQFRLQDSPPPTPKLHRYNYTLKCSTWIWGQPFVG
jgi:hypothetical protein